MSRFDCVFIFSRVRFQDRQFESLGGMFVNLRADAILSTRGNASNVALVTLGMIRSVHFSSTAGDRQHRDWRRSRFAGDALSRLRVRSWPVPLILLKET